jgi:glucosylceramidase
LRQQTSLQFKKVSSSANVKEIKVNDLVKHQQMDGFGGSLTDASSWLLKYKLSDLKRAEVIAKLFGTQGINLSLLRQPIGSSDFGWEAWTFDDASVDDWSLKNFALWRENDYIRPILNLALNVNRGRIKLFASPWSPPAWMKTNRSMNGISGGTLRKECYDVYAEYFVKYIKENEKLGSPVYAVTIQNEPLYAPNYPGMLMSQSDQASFIKNYLAPKFSANGLATKIVGFDHNYDAEGVKYARELLNDKEVNRVIAGIGFHTYANPNHQAIAELHKGFGKEYWITEAGSGTWIGISTLSQTSLFNFQ